MQDLSGKLFVFHDDNGVFTDYSSEALDYGRDSFTLSFIAAEDRLLVGFKKPINSLYFHFVTPNASSVGLTFKRYNGSWVSLDGLQDNTNGFTRSGFVDWKRNQHTDSTKEFETDEVEQTINGETGYFYEITSDTDLDGGFEVQGLNILFSDDQDLKNESPRVDRYLAPNETSFVTRHQSARNHIVQMLRNRGNVKQKRNGRLLNMTQWDLLDRFEIREASKFLVLSKIYFNASDDHEDTNYQRHLKYAEQFKDAFELFFSSIDRDDDGIADREEEARSRIINIVRI